MLVIFFFFLVTKSQLLLILCDLLPVFIIEGKAKFQLKGSENKDKTVFFPPKLMDPLNSIQGLFGHPWIPG